MSYQYLLVPLRQSASGGLEMTRHDLILAHRIFGEKTVSRLGAGPILTGIRDTFTDSIGHHLQ